MQKPEIITVVTYTCPIYKNNGLSLNEAINCRDNHAMPAEVVEVCFPKTKNKFPGKYHSLSNEEEKITEEENP